VTSRERVLAALQRKPVGRIPYCEHLVDVNVVYGTLPGGPQRLAEPMQQGMSASSGAGVNPFVLFGALEPEISTMLDRDNITYWGGASCFAGGTPYLLDPNTPDKGMSADGIVRNRHAISSVRHKGSLRWVGWASSCARTRRLLPEQYSSP